MDREIFGAGIAPGAPTTQSEIKLLLCHILYTLGRPASLGQLYDVLSARELVNYFELIEALEQLVASGHLERDGRGESRPYLLTDLGKRTAKELSGTLPRAAREKAAEAASLAVRRARRLEELSVQIRPENSGYRISLAIPDRQGELLAVSLYVPTMAECEQIRRQFLNDPVFIYRGVLALLTGDLDTLRGLAPSPEQLF